MWQTGKHGGGAAENRRKRTRPIFLLFVLGQA